MHRFITASGNRCCSLTFVLCTGTRCVLTCICKVQALVHVRNGVQHVSLWHVHARVLTCMAKVKGEPSDDTHGADVGVAELHEAACLEPDVLRSIVYADLQRVPPRCGGLEQRTLFCRQIENVGVRLWTHNVHVDAAEPWESVMNKGYLHLTAWVFVTDQGADQKGAHSLIMREMANHLPIMLFRSWCFEHIIHLMVSCARTNIVH
jgi:hypothetical protein